MESSEGVELLKAVQSIREKTKLQELPLDKLRALTGSVDETMADTATQQLIRRWYLMNSERSAENVPSSDLVALVESFPPEERDLILSHANQISLTEGCNSHCNFCMYGLNPGVVNKFSFRSIQEFLRKYSGKMRSQVYFYQLSDPFDYCDEDGDEKFTFTDVYKEYRTHSATTQFISTAIPPGSADRFVAFVEYLASECKSKPEVNTSVRLSITDHNADRVEAALKLCTERLSASGYTTQEIDAFFKKYFVAEDRTEGKYLNIGNLISKRDLFADIRSSAGGEGVAITPHGCESNILVCPTPYTPAGYENILLLPNASLQYIIKTRYIHPYVNPETKLAFQIQLASEVTLLPVAMRADYKSKIFSVPRPEGNFYAPECFWVSRDVLSLGYSLRLISLLGENPGWRELSDEEKTQYLMLTASEMKKRINTITSLIGPMFLRAKRLQPPESVQHEYYATLGQYYADRAQIVVDTITKLKSIETTVSIAGMMVNLKNLNIANDPTITRFVESLDSIKDN